MISLHDRVFYDLMDLLYFRIDKDGLCVWITPMFDGGE